MGRRARLGLALIAVITHLALLLLYWAPEAKTVMGDELTYLAAAGRLLRGEPAALDPLWPPLYPRVVAACLWLGQGRLWALQAAQTLLLILFGLLMREVARGLIGRGVAPDLVAFSAVAYPPLAAFSHYLWPEVLHLFLVAAMLWILTFRSASQGWLAVFGLALGLSVQTKSILQGFFPVLLLPLSRGGLGGGARRVALVVGVAGLSAIPSVVTNWERHGIPLIAEPVLFNLWVGLNDRGLESFAEPVVQSEFLAYARSSPNSLERRRILARTSGSASSTAASFTATRS
jgi:hypothetical protein